MHQLPGVPTLEAIVDAFTHPLLERSAHGGAGWKSYFALVALTFSEARPGDIVLYEDAYGNAAIAINQGSAAEMFGVRSGQELRLRVRK